MSNGLGIAPVRAANRHSNYARWIEAEGLTIADGNYQRDLTAVASTPWPRIGGSVAILNHDRSDASNDCWIVDIPPGGALREEAHLHEELVYVLSGLGATRVWQEPGDERVFEWQAGSLFAVPLNSAHQHLNGSGDRPARLLMVTNLPLLLNVFESPEFVYGCSYRFTERFDGRPDYFDGDGTLDGRVWSTNFIADVPSFKLLDYPERGGGGQNIHLSIAGNAMKAHISEFAVGRYKKAHRHGAGAHVVILSGEGYSLMWPEGGDRQTYHWGPGSLIVPPEGWFHQHFNVGDTPARYLAMRYIDNEPKTADGVSLSRVSTRLGGNQIEYEDEDPVIRAEYEAAIADSRHAEENR